jgi:hypothetical protein
MSARRAEALTPLERAYLQIVQRRDPSRRWHIIRRRKGQPSKDTSALSSMGSQEAERKGPEG